MGRAAALEGAVTDDRGAQICTPYNLDDGDPAGARFRRTSHNDEAFVGRVSELVSPT